MFQFSKLQSITLNEFLQEYNQTSWLGFISKEADHVYHGQRTVRRVSEQDFSNKTDVYLSYNPLKGYVPRNKSNVGRLALLYVDLDIGRGKNPFEDDTTLEYKQRLIDALIQNEFGINIPEPNYICDSGRGIYLIYIIYQNQKMTKQEHANAAERWERINSFISSQLVDYCADKSVSTDEARVLRIPESINSHTGSHVKYYVYSKNVYTLYNIERDYMSAPTVAQIKKLERVEKRLGIKCNVRNRRSVRRFLDCNEEAYIKEYNKAKPTEKQLKYASDIARTLHIECPNFRTAGGVNRFIKKYQKNFLTEKAKRKNYRKFIINDDERTLKMIKTRLNRIEKVLINAPKDSYREIGLFLYRLFACELTGDKEHSAEMTRNLIRKMKNPINEKNAMRTTKTAESYWENESIYKMTDATIAEWFNMSVTEWKSLIPKEMSFEDKEARKERNRRYYVRKLKKTGEEIKNQKISKRREEITRLLGEGKTKNEICEKLQISERTYYADIKYIRENTSGEEAQNVDATTAKKLDAFSNSGPLGPTWVGNGNIFHTAIPCIVLNPFVGDVCLNDGDGEDCSFIMQKEVSGWDDS